MTLIKACNKIINYMKKLTNKHLWLIVGLLTISMQGMGQKVTHNITGTLISDDNDKPLEYAEVLISDISNNTIKSVLTDEKGTFSIDLEKGMYILRYKELGEILKRDTIDFTNDKNLGIIRLPIVNKKLQEVTVVGMKRIITFNENSLVYNVRNSPYANGFKANDVIKNVPGINPSNPEEISLVGKDNVIVLINGRKTNLKGRNLVNYLNSIPSDDLDKIEIVTNPSSAFSASGNTGVLNIVLKNRKNLGLDGSLNIGYLQRRKTSFEKGGNITVSNNWLTVEYGLGYWKEKRMHDVRNCFEYIDYTKLINNKTYQKSDYISQNLNTNIFLNNKMNIGFMSSFNYMDEDGMSDVYQEKFGSRKYFSSEKTRSNNRYKGFSFSPYYEWNIDSLGKKLLINYNYNLAKNMSNSSYTSDNQLELSNSLYDNSYFVNTLNMNLTLPFSWIRFELGGEYAHYHADNYSRYNIVDDFLYKESIGSFYADISTTWKKMFLKLGVRYEHTKSEGFPREETNHFSKSYANWFPFIDISYKSGDNSVLYLGYSKRINRPEMMQLNPARTYSDAYTYLAGNSLLKPSLMDYLEFRYQYKTLSIGVSYIHTSDGIGLLVNDNENSQTEQTYSNCISTNSLMGNVSYIYSHNRCNAAIQLSVNYNKSKSSDLSLNSGALEGFCSFVTTNLSYRIGSKGLAYARYLYYFPGQEQYIHYNSFQNLSIGFNWVLMKNKLILDVNVNDLFGTYYNRNHVVYENCVFNNRNDYDNRCLNIKLTYKFGNHKVKHNNVDINISNNRLPNINK